MIVREEYILFPELQRYSDIPLFNTKAVVQQTGIPAPTLRAWERRYAILSPERALNDYRRYSERDIAIIRWLKERVDAGMAISQAIALFRHLHEEHLQTSQSQVKVSVAESGDFFQVTPPTSPGNKQVLAPADHLTEAQVEAQGEAASSLWNKPQADIEQALKVYPATYNMRSMKPLLMEAFKILDESTASRLMTSMLAVYTVEQVCTELITPTLWKIGKLWEQGEITVSIEHFASAFFRGLLTSLLHVTPDSSAGPLVIACCAPGEAHELAPLMLALFLRRAGMHVAYLGQSIETAGLLHTIRQLTPALICVSMTLPYYLDALIDLGEQVQKLPPPRPILVFGGQGFGQQKDAAAQVPGVYLDEEMYSTIVQLRHMVDEWGRG